MSRVLAVIDDDPVRRQVLEVGVALADVYGATLEAAHVRVPDHVVPSVEDDIAAPLHTLVGDVTSEIVAAINESDVVAGVIGARTDRRDRRPAGSVAFEVATRVVKPLALVPPGTPSLEKSRALRVLVPLDGTDASAAAIGGLVQRLARAGVDIVILHVFGDGSVPRFLDRAEHDLPVWAREFAARYCDEPNCAVEWRCGSVGQEIADVARSEKVDGVIMGWGQDAGEDKAAAVRGTLVGAGVPVVLVPRCWS